MKVVWGGVVHVCNWIDMTPGDMERRVLINFAASDPDPERYYKKNIFRDNDNLRRSGGP